MKRDQVIDKYRAFVAAEGDTLGRLLAAAERAVIERTLMRLDAAERGVISFAQFQLMQQICLSSMRLTQLAERMGMSKQAVAQLVDGLESKRLVHRTPDPDDGRAKIIGYTDEGYNLIAVLLDAAMAAEAELAAAMGSDELKSLKAVLIRIGDTQPSTFQNNAG